MHFDYMHTPMRPRALSAMNTCVTPRVSKGPLAIPSSLLSPMEALPTVYYR